MARKMTSMRIDEELLEKAKKYEINISAFLGIELRRYIALIEGKYGPSSSYQLDNDIDRKNRKGDECGRRESNPGSELGRLKS